MINLEELQKNINQQTRNGRTNIYMPVSILKELGANINNSQKESEFINIDCLENLIMQYKKSSFKNSLKVETKKSQIKPIVKHMEDKIKDKELER